MYVTCVWKSVRVRVRKRVRAHTLYFMCRFVDDVSVHRVLVHRDKIKNAHFSLLQHPNQATPTFEAKGVETVRRDSCPAVAALMEKSLQILFESKDLSRVKEYLTRQFGKILNHRVSVKDFIFAKVLGFPVYVCTK